MYVNRYHLHILIMTRCVHTLFDYKAYCCISNVIGTEQIASYQRGWGSLFMKMLSYQYRDPQYKGKAVSRKHCHL